MKENLTPYQKRLLDPRWQKKRLEILNRDNWTCQSCANKKNTLHIHHLEYKRSPWGVPNEHLITYCEKCHELIEKFKINFPESKLIQVKESEGWTLVSIFTNSKVHFFKKTPENTSLQYILCLTSKTLSNHFEALQILK